MTWIQENETNYDFCFTYQKMLYRLWKLYSFDSDWFFKILETHYEYWELLEKEKIDVKKYFEIIWRITDIFNKKSKEMKQRKEIKKDLCVLYGWMVNRQKEWGVWEGEEDGQETEMR